MTLKALIAGTALAVLASSAAADDFNRFPVASKSVLSPDQEVPVAGLPDPTDPDAGSNGLGNAIIEFNGRYTRARMKVTFSNLSGDFTRLHLHCNVVGSNGPIALGIIDLVAIGQDNSETARLDSNRVVARLANDQFLPNSCESTVGQPIHNLRQLAYAIDAGLIYYNLHTARFPAGELRGQVEPLERARGKY